MQILEQLKKLSYSLEKCETPADAINLMKDYTSADRLKGENKDFLDIVSFMIRLKVKNLALNEKMQKGLEFHNAMKNIAKIIESQYELDYIIPIIGEILDTFIPDRFYGRPRDWHFNFNTSAPVTGIAIIIAKAFQAAYKRSF